MKKESLYQAINIMIEELGKSNIDDVDKLELMVNLRKILDPENYKDNIDFLKQKEQEKGKLR